MLLAKLKVKEDKIAEYLEIADKTDKAVEADEPGMLHHTFDQDPDDPYLFVMSVNSICRDCFTLLSESFTFYLF